MGLSEALYGFLRSIGYAHPLHPAVVHMPIGLVVGALVFGFAAPFIRKPRLERAAYYCLVLAFLFLFPTILLGYMDWQHFFAGGWIFYIKMKLALAVVLFVLIVVGLILGRRAGVATRSLMTIYALGFLTVTALGYYGGQLVYAGRTPAAPAAHQAGAQIYDTSCASCHPQGGNIVQPNLPVLKAPQLKTSATFIAWLRDPKRPDGSPGIMPPFPPDRISDQQADELRNYIIHVLENPRGQPSAGAAE
jgi:mono/diheme cytochrome c family protein